MLKHAKKSTLLFVYLILAAGLIMSVVAAINMGSVDIRPSSVFKIIYGKMFDADILEEFSKNQISIVWSLRFPKVLVAACTGAGLALAGILMQALTKNALADPYILGISSGASTGAVLSLLIGTLPVVGRIPLAEGAFAGALLTSILVFVIGSNGTRIDTTKMVLVGMSLSALFSSATSLIIFLTPDARRVQNAMFWMSGSFAGAGWSDVPLAMIVTLIGILAVYPMSRELDALLMGEDIARNAGVNTTAVKWILILMSTLLTAVLVSVSGVIGFVGLVIPHITRSIVGAAHKRMIIISVFIGAIFMIWTDLVARTLVSPKELPVGVVTSLCGAPFFLIMLKKSRYSFKR